MDRPSQFTGLIVISWLLAEAPNNIFKVNHDFDIDLVNANKVFRASSNVAKIFPVLKLKVEMRKHHKNYKFLSMLDEELWRDLIANFRIPAFACNSCSLHQSVTLYVDRPRRIQLKPQMDVIPDHSLIEQIFV